MSVVIAAVLAVGTLVPPPPLKLTYTPIELSMMDPADRPLTPVERWAPFALTVLDGVSTLIVIAEQKRMFEGELAWPRGEMNPAIRWSTDKPALFLGLKAVEGLLKTHAVVRLEKKGNHRGARNRTRYFSAVSAGMVVGNMGPMVAVTVF